MLSVLIVCRTVDDLLIRTVRSVIPLNPQILIDISQESKEALGVRKNRLISQATHEWVLVLDTDEVVSPMLQKEIENVVHSSIFHIHGFRIHYQNYIFSQAVYFGGERFSRIQLFRKKYGSFTPALVHEHPIIVGKVSPLKGAINHYSYVTILGVLTKFTKYAWQISGEKIKMNELVTLKKLFMYGPHMVWARAVKDEGWRDGWRGIVIALCFGYMEALTYWMLLWRKLFG